MAISIAALTSACQKINAVNVKIADVVCEALEEKYDEKFEADKIGDRYGTGRAKLILHPVDNEDIVFEAVIYNDTKEVKDTYLGRKMAYKWNKDLEKMGKEAGLEIKVQAVAGAYGDKDEEIKDYTPGEFFRMHEYYGAHAIVAVKTDYEGLIPEQLEKFEEMAQQLERELDYPTGLEIYFYDETGYKKACETIEKYSSVTNSYMKEADPYKGIIVFSEDGVVTNNIVD